MALDERSSSLRQQVLVPNAGWLGEGVTILADLLGVWDIFVLMAFFVVFWVIIRTTSCEVSFVLGMLFDLGIPLQYQNDKAISLMHEPHLQAYWPIFGLGSIAEVAGYLFFHPDLFTLVVCMKTTGCLALWLSRRADGSKIALRGGGRRPARIPPINGWDGRPIPPLRDRDFPDAEARLLAAGYDPLIVEGMIHALRRTEKDDKPRNMREWTRVGLNDPARMENRRKKYTERALNARQERLAKALRGERGSGIPEEVLVGLGRSSGGQSAQTRRDPDYRRDHRPPPITTIPPRDAQNNPPRPPAQSNPAGPPHPPPPHAPIRNAQAQPPRDGSWVYGGRVMAFSKEQINQITEKLTELFRKKHGSTKAAGMAKAQVAELLKITDPRELQQALASLGVIVQNPTRLRLADDYTTSELLARAKKLMYPHEKGGLGVPRQIADLMMEHVLSQRSKPEAERLFESWMALRKLDPGRRMTELRRLVNRFGDSIYLAEEDTPKHIINQDRLVQPWDIPGW